MKVPAPNELNEFNRVIGVIHELSDKGSGCQVSIIIDLCSSITFGGRPSNHRRVIRLAEYAGLLTKNESGLLLTELGEEFLSLNQDFSYKLTDIQKDFVAGKLIFNGPWKNRARGFLQIFEPNHRKVTFEFNTLNNEIPRVYSRIRHLLLNLGVVRDEEGIIYVEPNFVARVVDLRDETTKTTLDELERLLDEKRKTGDIAEDAVLRYEKERLEKLGRKVESDLVRRISKLDTAAGYDIESFDGDKPLTDYDRFIEVKGSMSESVRFYWTANERDVAERLRGKYWIYFVPNIKTTDMESIKPIMFNDPYNRLNEVDGLAIEPSTYLITQAKTP